MKFLFNFLNFDQFIQLVKRVIFQLIQYFKTLFLLKDFIYQFKNTIL
jgi:hypothetical protein